MIIRQAELHDICVLKDTLREADKLEVMASHGATPEKALLMSYIQSEVCFTIEFEGQPIGMFGVVPDHAEKACVWLLGSDKIKDVKQDFFKQSTIWINHLLSEYPVLYNYVDARYVKSVKWLKHCGAIVEEAKSWGVSSLPFHYFELRRREP